MRSRATLARENEKQQARNKPSEPVSTRALSARTAASARWMRGMISRNTAAVQSQEDKFHLPLRLAISFFFFLHVSIVSHRDERSDLESFQLLCYLFLQVFSRDTLFFFYLANIFNIVAAEYTIQRFDLEF